MIQIQVQAPTGVDPSVIRDGPMPHFPPHHDVKHIKCPRHDDPEELIHPGRAKEKCRPERDPCKSCAHLARYCASKN